MKPIPQVIFTVPPFVHPLDLTGPVQVFYEAGTYGISYPMRYCSFQDAVVSSAGLGFGPLTPFDELTTRPGDLIFLPGLEMDYLRSEQFRGEGRAFFEWLRQQHAGGARLCSVCTGAFILAETGLLNGRKCTTHWNRLEELQTRYPKVITQPDRLFVEDGNICSSAGVTAGIDMALYLLEQQHGPFFTTKVAREMVVYFRRGDRHAQQSIYLDYRNHINSSIHKVQDWLIANLSAGASLEELAEIANMSARNLTRTFRKETGISVQEYTTLLRLELARTLGNNPDLTQEAIARQCGFQQARQLRRILEKHKHHPFSTPVSIS